MNNLDIQEFLESIYSYIDKRIKDTSGSAAKIIGGTVTGVTNSGRYKVKINKFDSDDNALKIFPLLDEREYNVGTGIDEETGELKTTKINGQHYKEGDNVFILYWGDLTNARILCKNE